MMLCFCVCVCVFFCDFFFFFVCVCDFFLYIKAYIVGIYLNCIDKSTQFKWVP